MRCGGDGKDVIERGKGFVLEIYFCSTICISFVVVEGFSLLNFLSFGKDKSEGEGVERERERIWEVRIQGGGCCY